MKLRLLSPAHGRLLFSVGVLLLAASLSLWHISSITPLGLSNDEASFLLQAQSIARLEATPVYIIIGNSGIEPFFFYLTAGVMLMLGPTAWVGRLATVCGGLLTIALTIRAGKEIFSSPSIGVLAGVLLTTLYWHLSLSRYGVQYIWVATAAVGAVTALWVGLKHGNAWAYVLSGLCLGIGLNTYVAFRLFPIVPLWAGFAWLLTQRGKLSVLIVGGLLTLGVALILYAPVAWFLFQHPEWFFYRFRQTTAVTLGANSASVSLASNFIKVLFGLLIQGDTDWRHNLSGRPALDAAQAFFFLMGSATLVRHWRKPETSTLLAWGLVGLLPSVLTERAPHFGRMIMITPILALLMAVGVATLWRMARSRVTRLLLVSAILLSATLTNWDYFVRWQRAPELFRHSKDTLIAYALQTAPPEARRYATPMHLEYYSENFWAIEFLLGADQYERLRTFNGRACLVFPSQTDVPTTYAVYVAEDQNSLPALIKAFPTGVRSSWVTYAGQPYLELFQIPAHQTAQTVIDIPRRVSFGELVQLRGYMLNSTSPQPGDTLNVTTTWEAQQSSATPYKIFLHLIGPPRADGNVIYSQYDSEPCANSYPTWQWQAGERVTETYSLTLPPDLPAGDYYLQMGWYESQGPRLSAVDESGHPLGDAVRLETFHFSQP